MRLTILYRGPLASCNYACPYCPFAKRTETPAQLDADRVALERFTHWCAAAPHLELSIFFTPWGEALIRPWYHTAISTLSSLPHIRKVAIQTNLSCDLAWLDTCQPARLGIWATYHPAQTPLEGFLARCHQLEQRHISYSVGVVGLREHREAIAELRRQLLPHIYLWINAYKHEPDYYSPELQAACTQIDPLFPLNLQPHASQDRPCHTGHTVLSVDGAGDIRRCHFVPAVFGNLYTPSWPKALRPRPCPNPTCHCHIGYIHMPHLGLEAIFGDGLLERVPADRSANGF